MYILLALAIFCALISIHEFGHFLVARLCGVEILEFAIGMGPKLVSWVSKKSGTRYSLRLLPIGGFVSMLGEDGMEAVQGSSEGDGKKDLLICEGTEEAVAEPPVIDEERAKHAYCNQSVWKRILISLAGPAMNVILGFALMLVMVLASGHAAVGTTEIAGFHVQYTAEESYQGLQGQDYIYAIDGKEVRSLQQIRDAINAKGEGATFQVTVRRMVEQQVVEEVLEGVALNQTLLNERFTTSLTEQSGLQIGDEVIRVNNVRVHTYHELGYEIMNQGHKPLELTVLRNGKTEVLENVIVPQYSESGAVFGEPDFMVYRERSFNALTVLKHTWYRSLSTVKMVFDSLFGLFSGRYGMEAVSGPVGITKTITDAAKTGWLNVLYLVTVISINLGVMNLLPVPALDGGHLLLYVIELIRRKPVKREIEGMINFIGLIVILALAVLIAMKDIYNLF